MLVRAEVRMPRCSIDDINLDLGPLYRISEGSEKHTSDSGSQSQELQLLLVACAGSAAQNQSQRRVRAGLEQPHNCLLKSMHLHNTCKYTHTRTRSREKGTRIVACVRS